MSILYTYNNLVRLVRRSAFGVMLLAAVLPSAAQYSATINGTVTDSSGAVIPNANVTLTNTSTIQKTSVKTNSAGFYTFANLAPDTYTVVAAAQGFGSVRAEVKVTTGQAFDVPMSLKPASSDQVVEVTTQSPLLDHEETRNVLTIESEGMEELPLPGQNALAVVAMAPGVVGLGAATNGSPGSGLDNFSTENQVDASANGQGLTGNLYIVDGLDVTSDARDGVANLVPNPETIAETAIQVNTFNVDYGRASSIQISMTTKAGSDHFHGALTDHYTTQQLWARQEQTPVTGYIPFHNNNISATLGGPISRHTGTFFFVGFQRLLGTQTVSSAPSFEDPAFVQWAQQTYPNSIGTSLLTKYPVRNVTNVVVAQTAKTAFGISTANCTTPPANQPPCTLPTLDSATFTASNTRNGMQYDARIDQYFHRDRIYAGFYRTTLNLDNNTPRPAFNTYQNFYQYSYQVNETHTFSPNKLNEASFSTLSIDGMGVDGHNNMFVPLLSISSLTPGLGVGAPLYYTQIQHRWRDMFTVLAGTHNVKVGYEGWAGNFVQDYNRTYSQPSYAVGSLLNLVRDQVNSETGIAYNPLSGNQSKFFWDTGQSTHGGFIEDSWHARKGLTLNLGIRYDDFGNVHANNSGSVIAPFYKQPFGTPNDQVANGSLHVQEHGLTHAVTNIISPRAAFAWSPSESGKWLIHGGGGVFRRWTTLGELNSPLKGNPPGVFLPIFQSGASPAPFISIGTSNTFPYGYSYPVIGPRTIDSHGGIVGLKATVGSPDPALHAPTVYIWSLAVERSLGQHLVATATYSGSRSKGLLSGASTAAVFYSVNINSYPGDLIQHKSLTNPTGLNPSFGTIRYETNDREGDYYGLIADLRGRFGRGGFFSASYTHSRSMDDAAAYPTWQNPMRYYSNSTWDVPDRFSLVGSYTIPGPSPSHAFLSRAAGGWALSTISVVQSGTPFTVVNGQPLRVTTDSAGNWNGYAVNSGDYNADGDANDYPNVVSYALPHDRNSYLNTGIFQKNLADSTLAFNYVNFPMPAFGTQGNERFDGFRNPGYIQANVALSKTTAISERVKLMVRIQCFNVFNHPNLLAVNGSIPQATFGRSPGSRDPRWIQLGGRLSF